MLFLKKQSGEDQREGIIGGKVRKLAIKTLQEELVNEKRIPIGV